jgi:hypothetical protein
LLAFVQSRTKIVDESSALRAFDELDSEARQEWLDRYVREEVLAREARTLGLDRQDELIRRRLAQKIEFLTLGLIEAELRVDDAQLEKLYQERGADYRVPTMLTFTHVFVRDSPSLAGLHSLAIAHDVGIRPARRARQAKRSCCEIPEAKANRVARAGEPSGSVKRRGRSASRGDASCGIMTDRGEAASSRVPSPGHLAPRSTALFAALQRCSWPAGITVNDLIG